MKKRSFIILAIAILFFSNTAIVKAELLRVKEGFKGAIQVYNGPTSEKNKVIGLVNASMTWTAAIVEATGDEEDEWIEIVCRGKCRSRYSYFWKNYYEGWVKKDFFRPVDIEGENLVGLQPAGYKNSRNILVHLTPDITDVSYNAVINNNGWNLCFVEKSGERFQEWLGIVNQEDRTRHSYVLGGYFGFRMRSPYNKYPQPRVFYTKGSDINTRVRPNILSRVLRQYPYKNQAVTIVGEQCPWYRTDEGEWIYYGWLTDTNE